MNYIRDLKFSNIYLEPEYIPTEFARSNGLIGRNCEIIMKDEKGRSWPLRLKHNRSHVCISRGFHHFLAATDLKEGVSFIIHLLQNGNKPLMNFCTIKFNAKICLDPVTSSVGLVSCRVKLGSGETMSRLLNGERR
ncbi:hypothetical protein LguiB_026690 [Lonicera macranthoides]